MKKIFFILVTMCISLTVFAQTMHTIIFINTEERDSRGYLQTHRAEDMRKMTAFADEVARRIGYKSNLHKHSGSEFTVAKAREELSNLNVQYNDVVLFYYHGHGTNTSRTDIKKWPAMHITPNGENRMPETYLEQSEVQTTLEKKCGKAKLVLCIADCCNSFSFRPVPSNRMGESSTDNIKKLFVGFEGQKFIMVSASRPGQVGYSDKTSGSIYGDFFRSAINYFSKQANPTWEDVLNKAQSDTNNHNVEYNSKNGPSVPQYQIFNRTQVKPSIITGDDDGELY